MNEAEKNVLSKKWLVIFAFLVLCVGMSASQAMAQACPTSAPTCTVGWVCTENNNFTMISPGDNGGGIVGGTNDMYFAWDGTMKTSVAVSGQVSNCVLNTDTLFFNFPWSANFPVIYGPGTYTIYPACPGGSPGCGDTVCPAGRVGCAIDKDSTWPPITFTVGPAELGFHHLVNWNTTKDIDCLNILQQNKVFGPSTMNNLSHDKSLNPPIISGDVGCGDNPADKEWDWMSSDWGWGTNQFIYPPPFTGFVDTIILEPYVDGINGVPMVDGPFNGQASTWNVMGSPCEGQLEGGNCNDNNPCTDDACAITDNTHGTCVHTPILDCVSCISLPEGSDCTDNSVCTMNDKCVSGQCKGTPVNCGDNNACTVDTCNYQTGCVLIPLNCDDANICTDDSCDPVAGCVHTNNTGDCGDGIKCNACFNGACSNIPGCVPDGVDSTNNNFTMIDAAGGLVGGTNDVHFTWDLTTKTEVAVSGQIKNATIGSTTAFFGHTWEAHDVAIYGPGTYTVYTDCPEKSPGCGVTTYSPPITFTVNADEIAGHMLFNWSGNENIDVVNIWTYEKKGDAFVGHAFAPSPMWTGAGGSNKADKLWDLMSKDWSPLGVTDDFNGYGMVDGPFKNFNANFNLMMKRNEIPSVPVLVSPLNGQAGLGTSVDFIWKRSTDSDGDPMTYTVVYCLDSAMSSTSNCTNAPLTFVKRNSNSMFYAGGAGMLMIGITFFGGLNGRRRIVLLLTIAVLFAGGSLMSCINTKIQDGKNLAVDELSLSATGLNPATTYYWKVSVTDGSAAVDSAMQQFKTK